jgi:hypothetical protein
MSNTINMRDFGLKMIAGVAIAGTVTIAMGTSAQAAVIGRVDFTGNADLNTTSIDFTGIGAPSSNGVGVPGTFSPLVLDGDFATALSPFPAIVGAIKDISVPFASISAATPLVDFITFAAAPSLNFKLTSFVLANPNLYTFTGVFADGTLGEGGISSANSAIDIGNNALGIRGFNGTLKAVAVPSPALLPGLIGIGMAAIRKRQSKTATA